MTREEILRIAKPILFNTDMVRAILKDRKTVTRRPIKYKYNNTEMKMHTDKYGTRLIEIQKNVEGETFGRNPDGSTWRKLLAYIEPKAPYQHGDILYVRETWCWCPCWDCGMDTEEGCCDKSADRFYNALKREYGCYGYRASFGDNEEPFGRWHPSIHMPKEAARIFLKVTDVWAGRVQDMDKVDAVKEGIDPRGCVNLAHALTKCKKLWDSTIQKKELDKYGWNANPWVWVIEFERVEVD